MSLLLNYPVEKFVKEGHGLGQYCRPRISPHGIEYYRHGGILHKVHRQMLEQEKKSFDH